jgi:hypothetical protein
LESIVKINNLSFHLLIVSQSHDILVDDGRLEQINYDARLVYPNENEEFCFEEVRFISSSNQ